ncbi:MAG: bifunctional UDP-N-acetylglucosamine diphosphorylase/glucosamine-1-phosphate N-acetyltransferase GlmU [Bradymonadaceae bacterium]
MPQPRSFQVVILAAGMGTRMKSGTVKVLHEVLGKPMIGHVVDTALSAGAERVINVLGHQRGRVEAYLDGHAQTDKIHVAYQEEQLGTAHAVLAAREFYEEAPEYTVILSGDVPNMDVTTLSVFLDEALGSGAELAAMTAVLDDAGTYGRMVRDEDGRLRRIVEFKDASEAERQIREINAGIYVTKTSFLAEHLPGLCAAPAENAQNEYYLTDLVAIAAEKGGAFGWPVPDIELIQGVNTRADLAGATAFARRRIIEYWMSEGVTFLDPERAIIESDVTLGVDITIYPGVHLAGRTDVGSNTVIEAGCYVLDSTIENDVHLKANCYITGAKIEELAAIGPFAHLRPEASIGRECKVGNFVEIKKTRMEDGSKASHLTYLGDARVGRGANVGAGTITCNYDGAKKFRTNIDDGAFIGSNTALVAPVRVGRGAYVGAGSVITEDVPDEALGVARGRQKNIEGWAAGKADT